MKRQSKAEIEQLPTITKESKVMMLGSCFTTEIGERLLNNGYKVQLNPFGILFNPASIASSIRRMESGEPFSDKDIIISDNKYTSFFHHSQFSRPSSDEFLSNANEKLFKSVIDFQEAEIIIVTFGTAWVFRHIARDIIVSNCHKIVSKEFSRERLTVSSIVEQFTTIIARNRNKQWIFTISPIRHLSDGCHGNQISKSTLMLSIDELQQRFNNVHYFPAYEIIMDELRDFSWFAEDTVHPSISAINIIYNRFVESINSGY